MLFCKTFRKFSWVLTTLVAFFTIASSASSEPAFKINSNVVSTDQLFKENQAKFYEVEKQKYELIENIARQQYLDAYWSELAKKKKISAAQAEADFVNSKAAVANSEVNDAIAKFKDHPRLKDLSEADKKQQIKDYLESVKKREVIEGILEEGLAQGKLKILYPKPQEPVYNVAYKKGDAVKYGPNPQDTKPLGCNDDCPITVIEYSEFQCPFCERVLPTVNRLMTEYKGKVRWVVRDFPLGFHDRAKPAAVAAHCAKDQNKFWEMYTKLFENQRKLDDNSLESYAKDIGLDLKKFTKCFKNPETKMAAIEENYRSGEQVGVTGTPAFFVNGRRLSGALPYEEFKKIFDEELAAAKRKS